MVSVAVVVSLAMVFEVLLKKRYALTTSPVVEAEDMVMAAVPADRRTVLRLVPVASEFSFLQRIVTRSLAA